MMDRTSRSRGFTLVELMITVVVAAIVMTAVASSFIGGIRMLGQVYVESELSVRTRELREKLLFHAAPSHDGVVYAGLLSGTNANQVIEGNCEKILMYATVLRTGATNGQVTAANMANQRTELVFRDSNSKRCSFFNEERYDQNAAFRWLRPGNLDFFAGRPSTGSSAGIITLDGQDPGRFYINVTARKTVAGFTVGHNERIVVPVFGKVQKSEVNGTGGLDR